MSDERQRELSRRLRMAPDGPSEVVTEEWAFWSVQHKKPPGSWVHPDPPEGDPAWWFTPWVGKRHKSDDPAVAAKHETKAHQVLDLMYRGNDYWTETRLLRTVETKSHRVEHVPAMWEAVGT